MKKLLSFLSIILLLNNIFVVNVFAWFQIDFQSFQIRVNNWTNYTWDIEVKPWDKLSILLSWQNKWDTISNPQVEMNFSSTNFTYNSTGLKTYLNSTVVYQDIPTSTFNPGVINVLPLAGTVDSQAYIDAYYVNLFINQNTSDNVLTIDSKITASWVSSSQISRNVFINSRPHIVDYYFEKAWIQTTQISRWWEKIDLIVKVKDYNGCENIDNWTVTANLSSLWLNSSEALSFVSCVSNTAIFKKSSIATLVLPKTVNFTYNDFAVIDESANSNLPNDDLTSFDNEDKKTNLILEVVSAGVPNVTLNILDDNIWWATNLTSSISFSWNQNWDYKIILGNDWSCASWTVLKDWTPYLADTQETLEINSSDLTLWNNSIFACLKNDESLTWSYNDNIVKDETVPEILTISVGPANVVLENSIAHFTCSEDWTFRVEKWWSWTIESWILIWTGEVVSWVLNNFIILNSDIDIYANDFNLFCLDKAENYISNKVTINKTTPPPSFEWKVTSFLDNDIDYDGLDWRDISITWNNQPGVDYEFFEAYMVYVLPSSVNLDVKKHTYLIYDVDKNTNSFQWTSLLKKDSAWNNFISNTDYKACVTIIWTNWVIWAPDCDNVTTLMWDIVNHATIIWAKFKSDTILEITTDTLLDTNILNHNAWLFSFMVNSNNVIGQSIASVDWTKLNINIPSLWNLWATWINLLVQTWAIRSQGWWFNNNQIFANITDGQTPQILDVVKNTTPVYGNFYTWLLNVWYKLLEEMKTSYTKIELIRTSWNVDSKEYMEFILWNKLLPWVHSKDLDLASLWLVNWTNYQLRVAGQDLAGNYNASDYIYNISYDSVWPNKIIQNVIPLYSTLTPLLSWNIPLDNYWNGSWVKEYKINVYNWNGCVWTINQSRTVTSNSNTISAVGNIAKYSWTVVAIDNVWNIWTVSDCSNFTVDTTVPEYSNFQIKDETFNSTTYIKKSDTIKVTSTITNTDINHIWLDLSMITGSSANNNELCSSPSAWITCSYIWNTVTYTLTAWNSITDWTKQVMFNSQNISGWNDNQQILSITADSSAPNIWAGAILTPVWLVWWVSTPVTWNVNKITDTIWLDHLDIEYSKWGTVWNSIWTSPNNWSIDWNTVLLSSWTDYKVRITAYDRAWNVSSLESWFFEVDNTEPTVPEDTITNPNWWEIFWSNWTEIITWNQASIVDTSLALNPIKLYYSLDSWSTWVLIGENLPNTWSYSWNHWTLNSETVLIKLVAYDKVWNFSNDKSDSEFTIDTIKPILSLDFASTPTDWSYINNSSFDISWNTSDDHFDNLYYSFLNTTTWEYFNWTSFGWTSVIFNSVCSDPVSNWTNNLCDSINFNLLSNITNWNNYRLQLKSVDEAWNEILTAPVNYIWDTINPLVWITNSDWTYFKDSINISWTSSDLWSGISSVKIQIKKGSEYWDWNDFVSNIETLNTTTTDNYNNWSYDFAYNWEDWEYEITAIAYDKSYKVNNNSETSIIVNKDATKPVITWWDSLFSSPIFKKIYIGWSDISILWDSSLISDAWVWLKDTPIKLEYLDWSEWKLISENELNDWNYTWTSAFLDSNVVKIRLSAVDKLGNIDYQGSSLFSIDSTPPSISSVETMDLDADWKIDALNVIMSEFIQDSSIDLWDFSISNWIWTAVSLETWDAVDDESFILKFDNIWDTALTPSISYVKWNLIDMAWKFAENHTDILSIDKAAPRLLSSEIYDVNLNWKFDKIVSYFSENLSTSTDISAWSVVNSLNWMSINSVSMSWSQVDTFLNEWTDFATDVWTMSLDFTSNTTWKDLNNNQAWSVTNWILEDKASPVAYKAEYFDINSNSKVDKVIITFSETVEQFYNEDFTFSWLDKTTWILSWNKIDFSITETSSDNNTWTSASFNFISWYLKDSLGNLVNNINNFSIVDKVIPKLISIKTFDNNWNGKIDNFILTYSEDINTNFANFIWSVDWYNIIWYSQWATNELLINVQEKADYDSWESPLVGIISNNSLGDLNWNLVPILAQRSSTDKVWPVITWARYDEINHKIFITTSEALNAITFLASNFILNNAWSYTITWVSFAEKSITLSNENIIFWTTSISFDSDLVEDLSWNAQIILNHVKLSPPIVINEIMLSDNSNNNYVELRNLSSSPVDISGYTIAWITIPSSSIINWNDYYLIAKNTQTNSILDIVPNLVDNNLNISWTSLILNNWTIDIDFASLTSWLFDTSTPKSVERKTNITDWLNASSWYVAQESVWFDSISSLGTPGSVNIYDGVAPIINNYTPSDNVLFPNWNLNISVDYSDNVWWLWVNTLTDILTLSKWSWTDWWSDVSSSYVDFSWKVISTTNSNYKINALPFWKYKAQFSISDYAGNRVTKTIVFYVDELTFKLNTPNVEIWKLIPWNNTFSDNEAILTIETVWAWFDIDMFKNWLFTNNWTDIIDFDWTTWFWFDKYDSWYSWLISPIWNNVNIINKVGEININWEKNIYTYRVKYWAKINVIQWAWNYNTEVGFEVRGVY